MMKYKEFNTWCNQRACDGCWGMQIAIICLDIIRQIQRESFWKRERKWQELNAEYGIENEIVIPINQKIEELHGKG